MTQEAICDTLVYTDRRLLKEFKWSSLKSKRLKRVRGASFEDIVEARLVAIKKHPQKENQNMMLFEYKNYIWNKPNWKNDCQYNSFCFLCHSTGDRS